MNCPNCKKDIPDDSKFCPYCGVEFVGGEEEKVEVTPENNEKTQTPSTEQPKQISEHELKKKSKTIQIIISVVVLVLVCGILVFIGVKTGKLGSREYVTDAQGEEIAVGTGTVEMSVRDTDGTVRKVTSDASLITSDAILAEYTEVMNKLKTSAPAFSKVNWQNLPTDHQSFGGIGGIVLPIIEKYVTSKDVAQTLSFASGNADKLPLNNSQYGCLLIDSSKITNAYNEILSDGQYKLVMTLADETNPSALSSGATSTTGTINGIFTPYETQNIISSVGSLALTDINFNYTGCTVTLIYDNKTNKVTDVTMTMNIDISAKTVLSVISARIVDNTEYNGFVYS